MVRKFYMLYQVLGIQHYQADDTLFVKHCGDKITRLIVYVNDIVLIINDGVEIPKLKINLAMQFEVKGSWTLEIFLGYGSDANTQGN